MKCRFCSDVATSVCGFTLSEPRIGFPSELKVGDLVQSSRDLQYAMIEQLAGPLTSPFVALGCRQYEFYTAQLSGKRHKGLQEFWRPSLPILVVRHELCAAPVCDAHYMDRGDTAVCAYHWIIEEVKSERKDDAVKLDHQPQLPSPILVRDAQSRRHSPPSIRRSARRNA